MIGDYPNPNEKTLEEIQSEIETGKRIDKIFLYFQMERERKETR